MHGFGIEAMKQPPSHDYVMDVISEVKELQRFNSVEISKLLKENDNFSLLHITENGSTLQIDVEKLVRLLPLHLTAVLLSSQIDEALLKYLLSGLRLLYSFCEIASRHPKLEQILLDDVRVSEQLLDLVFYVLIVCSACEQGLPSSGSVPLVYSALVGCSLHLLTACISSQWNEVAYVLHVHPKVDIFTDAAFGAVRRNINLLQIDLSAEGYNFHSNLGLAYEKKVYFCSQQCEASLQFLQQVCQNKCFRERLLKNKELCEKGGVLRLVDAALKLKVSAVLKDSLAVIAAVSRLKARVLSILLLLCETDNVSYLDEVASIPESLNLAKSVVLEVVTMLKTMLCGDFISPEKYSGKGYPMGLLQLNALRLADIFSDDSNFRSYITVYFTEVLAAILSIPYHQFLSTWCSSDVPLTEENFSLDYEPFTVAGWVLDLASPLDVVKVGIYESNFTLTGISQAPYAHHRTSLLVKVIANLHCFVPKICKEQERNLFLQKFLEHLKMKWQDSQASLHSQPLVEVSLCSAPQEAATICENLRSLLGHAESLIPAFLNEEDVQLLRVFYTQLQSLIEPVDYEVNGTMALENSRGCSSSLHGGVELAGKNSNMKEGMSENSAFPGVDGSYVPEEHVGEANGVLQDDNAFEDKSSRGCLDRFGEMELEVQIAETSGSGSSSTRGKNCTGHVSNGEITKSCENSEKNIRGSHAIERPSGGLTSEEKRIKKRKRSIMNDEQVSIINRVLLEEPDLHKKAALLQSWADKLSSHGSEVTSPQLKNWLNNRKAKLARAAAKDGRSSSEEIPMGEKQCGSIARPLSVSPELVSKDLSAPAGNQNKAPSENMSRSLETVRPESSAQLNTQNNCQVSGSNFARLEPGQAVLLTDPQGKELAKGTVFQVEGEWRGCSLADTRACVVDITELKSDRIVKLSNPSVESGAIFGEAEIKVGNMRVLWDSGQIRVQ